MKRGKKDKFLPRGCNNEHLLYFLNKLEREVLLLGIVERIKFCSKFFKAAYFNSK